MKISQMLKREDFYAINERTLANYYKDGKGSSLLYVYPKLNAIITKKPSRAVKDYLFCEYEIRSNPLKKLLVNIYVFACLNIGGLLADKKTHVTAKVGNDVLIYPCNKKYRIFNFKNNTVDVIAKDGFNNNDLLREIEFRTKKGLPDFVPSLVSADNNGYCEKIIDGKPLARVQNGFEGYKQKAYALLWEYAKHDAKAVEGKAYAQQLEQKIAELTTNKVEQKEILKNVVKKLCDICCSMDKIQLCFSHGDLQVGNIWIENKTEKIYIIDWESWGTRSVWYDQAVLFDGLRPLPFIDYLCKEIDINKKAVVLLEDIIFNLNELNNLPSDFGQEKFSKYIKEINSWTKDL